MADDLAHMKTEKWRRFCERVLFLNDRKCGKCCSTYKVHVHPKRYIHTRKAVPALFDVRCAKCWAKEMGVGKKPAKRTYEVRERGKGAVAVFTQAIASGPSFDRAPHIPLVGDDQKI